MLGGEIRVVMTLDDKDFSVKTIKNGRVVSDMRRQIEATTRATDGLGNSLGTVGQQFRQTLLTISLFRFALKDVHDIFLALPAAVVRTSGEIERLGTLLKGLSGSAEQAQTHLKYVFDLAQRSPFTVGALTDAFVKLKVGGLDPTKGSLQALTDSIAKFGGGSETLKRAAVAIQQMGGKGVISMEELRQQLGEAVPTAMQAMAKGMNLSMAELTKLVSKGVVESQDAMRRMFTVLAIENEGASREMMKTWNGMLAQLETKWELFKLKVGGKDDANGLFGTAKEQLQLLLDAFDSSAATEFAIKLGDALADAARVIVSVKDTFVQFSGEIKTAGELLLLYFVGSKITGGMSAMLSRFNELRAVAQKQAAERLAAMQADHNAMVADAAARAREIEQMQAANLAKIEAEKKLSATKTAEREAQLRAEIANNQKRIAAHNATLDTYRAADQQYLNQQLAAEMEADRIRRQRKAGSAAAARVYDRQAEGYFTSRAVLAVSGDAERQAIATLRAQNEQLERQIRVLREVGTLRSAEQRLLATQNLTLETTRQKYQAVADSVFKLNTAQLAAQRIVTASQFVWSALGGWLGVVTGAVMLLTSAWMNNKSAAEQAIEAQRRAQRAGAGIFSEEDAKRTKQDLKEVADRLKALQEGKSRGYMIEQTGLGPVKLNWGARNEQELADLLKRQRELLDTSAKQMIAAEEANVEAIVAVHQKGLERRLAAISSEFSKEKAKRDKSNKDRLDAVKNDEAAVEKLRSEFEKIDRAAVIKRTEDELDAISTSLTSTRDQIAKIKDSARIGPLTKEQSDDLRGFEAWVAKASEKYSELSDRLVNLQHLNDPNKFLTAKGGAKTAKEHPMVQSLEQEAAALEQAKAKYESVVNETRGIADLRKEAAFAVFGDIASGKFDYKDKNEKGQTTIDYFGDLKARQTYVAKFAEALRSGQTDINAFVGSLSGLSSAESDQIKRLIDLKAEQERFGEGTRALTAAQQLAARSNEDLLAAMDSYSADGLAKQSRGLSALKRQLEAIEVRLRVGTQEFNEFAAAKARALVNQASRDAYDYGSGAARNLRDAEIAAITEVSRRRQAAHQENLRRITAEFEAVKKGIEEQLNLETTSVDDKKKLEASLAVARKAYREETKAAEIDYAQASKTELQHLRDEWLDLTQQMNQASADWARNFLTEVQNVTETGKFSWRSLLTSMLQDTNRALLQKGFGGLITSGMQSIGGLVQKGISFVTGNSSPTAGAGGFDSFLNSLFGNDQTQQGNLPVDPTLNAVRVTTVGGGALGASGELDPVEAGKQTMFQTVREKLMGVFDWMKSGFSSVLDNVDGWFGDLVSGIGDNFSGLFEGLGSWISQLFSGGGGAGGGNWMSQLGTLAMSFFEDGGIMTKFGSLPLKKYAKGGIANSPQLALFGEGRKPEAYVPLPDGRSIPVTIAGGTAAGGGTPSVIENNVKIEINVQSGGTSNTTSNARDSVWTEIAEKVEGVVMNTLTKQQRPGGMFAR